MDHRAQRDMSPGRRASLGRSKPRFWPQRIKLNPAITTKAAAATRAITISGFKGPMRVVVRVIFASQRVPFADA